MSLFLDELNNLLRHLGIAESGYCVFGQSWGGMLGAEFAVVTQPAGLRALVIANSPASRVTWVIATEPHSHAPLRNDAG